jgi:hypothetical protein
VCPCEFPEWTFGCLLQMKAFSALFCYKLYDPPLSSGLTPNRRWTSHMQMLPSSHTCLHTYHNINQSHHLFQLHKQNTLSMMIALVQRKKISNHELQHKPNTPSLSNYINKTYHLRRLCCAQKIGVRFDWNIWNLGAIISHHHHHHHHHHHPCRCQNEWLYFLYSLMIVWTNCLSHRKWVWLISQVTRQIFCKECLGQTHDPEIMRSFSNSERWFGLWKLCTTIKVLHVQEEQT